MPLPVLWLLPSTLQSITRMKCKLVTSGAVLLSPIVYRESRYFSFLTEKGKRMNRATINMMVK